MEREDGKTGELQNWGLADAFRILHVGPGEAEFWVVWWAPNPQGQQHVHVIHVQNWSTVNDYLQLFSKEARWLIDEPYFRDADAIAEWRRVRPGIEKTAAQFVAAARELFAEEFA